MNLMPHRHSLLSLVVASAAFASEGRAADKVSLACIQASDEGQTSRDTGNLLKARQLFAECALAKCPALIRRDCTAWLEQVELLIPSVVFGAHDADGRDVLDAKVTIDGQAPDKQLDGSSIELNPGPHVVRWAAPGREPIEMRIAVRVQEKNRPLVATFAGSASATPPGPGSMPDPTANPQPGFPASTATAGFSSARGGLPVGAYVTGGIGVVALGTFTYFALRAKRDSDVLHETCAPGCNHNDVAALKTKLIVADVALGIGVVGLAAATFIALRGRSAPSARAWDLRVLPAYGGGIRGDVEVRF
jgi:hypothetical protein